MRSDSSIFGLSLRLQALGTGLRVTWCADSIVGLSCPCHVGRHKKSPLIICTYTSSWLFSTREPCLTLLFSHKEATGQRPGTSQGDACSMGGSATIATQSPVYFFLYHSPSQSYLTFRELWEDIKISIAPAHNS